MKTAGAKRLKCRLCRRGLLQKYNVYDLPEEGAPILYSVVNGYFYRKGSRHSAEVLEIAGNLSEKSAYTCRMIAFANDDGTPGCKVGDLIEVGGIGKTVYKVAETNEIYDICYVLELEVWPYAISH